MRDGFAALRAQWGFVCVALILVAELGFLVLYRQVNLDEGWYLWASKLVYEGKLLYRDFAYTQTPLLPYVYGLGQLVVGEGLYQGRVLTALFALLAIGLSAATAARLAGRTAALVTLALISASFFALAQFTYTATYALTASLLAAALWVALAPWPDTRRNVGATLLVCLAVGVRLSVVVVLPWMMLFLVLTSLQRLRALATVFAASALGLGLALGLYWLLSGELMVYDIVGFHTDRLLRAEWHQLRMWHMGWRTLFDFLALIGFTVAAGVTGAWRLGRAWADPMARRRALFLLLLCVMTGTLFVAHLMPRTTDSYYNTLQMPMMSLAGGVLLAMWLAHEGPRARRYLWLLIGIVLVAHAARQGSGFHRDQYVVTPVRNQVALVREAAALLRRFTAPDDTLLSFSPHLALEAGLRVKPGYEMAIFAYRPTWSDEKAARYRVVNNTRLLADLRAGADAVAFTGFDVEQIYGEHEAMQQALTAHYRWVAQVGGLGPYNDALDLYLPPQFGDPQPQTHHPADFAAPLALLGYDLNGSPRGDTAALSVALYWRALAPIATAYTVFVQLLDMGGALAVGWDNPPCRGTCPTDTWLAGEFVRDEYLLPLSGLPPGEYTLHVGLYDPETGERLPVLSPAGGVVGDSVVLTSVSRP